MWFYFAQSDGHYVLQPKNEEFPSSYVLKFAMTRPGQYKQNKQMIVSVYVLYCKTEVRLPSPY